MGQLQLAGSGRGRKGPSFEQLQEYLNQKKASNDTSSTKASGVYDTTNVSPEMVRKYNKTQEAKKNALSLVNKFIRNNVKPTNGTPNKYGIPLDPLHMPLEQYINFVRDSDKKSGKAMSDFLEGLINPTKGVKQGNNNSADWVLSKVYEKIPNARNVRPQSSTSKSSTDESKYSYPNSKNYRSENYKNTGYEQPEQTEYSKYKYSKPHHADRSKGATESYEKFKATEGSSGSKVPPTFNSGIKKGSDTGEYTGMKPLPETETQTQRVSGGNRGGARFNMGLAQAMGNMQGDSGKALDNLDKLYDPAVQTKFLNTLDTMDPQTRASLAPYMYKLGLTDENGFLPTTANGVDEARTRAFNNAYALDNLSKDQIAQLKGSGEINPVTGLATVKKRDYLDDAQVMLDYLYGGNPTMQDWIDYDSARRAYNLSPISYADYQKIPNKGNIYDDLEREINNQPSYNYRTWENSTLPQATPEASQTPYNYRTWENNSAQSTSPFDTSPENFYRLANAGKLGNGKDRLKNWIDLGGDEASYQAGQKYLNGMYAKSYARNKVNEKVNTPIAPRPTSQEVMARKAQQDEMLRQSMLKTVQNPNSSVRQNMPDYFNSSTTLQNYYLTNPDLWGRR